MGPSSSSFPMLSRRRCRQVGSVFTGLLLYQSLFMAVGACAQEHESDHAGGEHGVASMAGHSESHGSPVASSATDQVHGQAIASSDLPVPDGAEACCAHHGPDPAASTGASGAVSDAHPEGSGSGNPDCLALSSCGTPVVNAEHGADDGISDGDSHSALRPAPLVPAIVDLSITPPPPKA